MLALCLVASLAQAQSVFEKNLFDPDLILKFKKEINLSDDQAEKIEVLYSAVSEKFVAKKNSLNAQLQAMNEALSGNSVDHATAQQIMAQMMALETEMKTLRFNLLLDVTEVLTQQQKAKLTDLKPADWQSWSPQLDWQPTRDVRVRISDNSSTEKPLILIKDKGKIYMISNDEMSGLEPNGIYSIEVIKDASLTVEYGPEGANGVIIIKLKEGNRIPSEARPWQMP